MLNYKLVTKEMHMSMENSILPLDKWLQPKRIVPLSWQSEQTDTLTPAGKA